MSAEITPQAIIVSNRLKKLCVIASVLEKCKRREISA
jgi:hypothetical protein